MVFRFVRILLQGSAANMSVLCAKKHASQVFMFWFYAYYERMHIPFKCDDFGWPALSPFTFYFIYYYIFVIIFADYYVVEVGSFRFVSSLREIYWLLSEQQFLL